jgi:hypothetical protein
MQSFITKMDERKSAKNNIGSGYLSEGSKTISFIPNLVDKVVITDYKGQQRNRFPGTGYCFKVILLNG